MGQTWEEVYAGIKTEMLGKISVAAKNIDFSGGFIKDAAQVLAGGVIITRIILSYIDQVQGLDDEGEENLFGQAFDDAIKVPGFVGTMIETVDGTVGRSLYREIKRQVA